MLPDDITHGTTGFDDSTNATPPNMCPYDDHVDAAYICLELQAPGTRVGHDSLHDHHALVVADPWHPPYVITGTRGDLWGLVRKAAELLKDAPS